MIAEWVDCADAEAEGEGDAEAKNDEEAAAVEGVIAEGVDPAADEENPEEGA